jgi:hypothetical protein
MAGDGGECLGGSGRVIRAHQGYIRARQGDDGVQHGESTAQEAPVPDGATREMGLSPAAAAEQAPRL